MNTYFPCVTLLLAAMTGMAAAEPPHDADPHGHSSELVGVGHDTTLAAGHDADSVVSIVGTTRILGHDRGDAVAIIGDTLVEGPVDGDVVALAGDVDLKSTAQVGGDVVTVFGDVRRDPAAFIHGDVHSIFDGGHGALGWLGAWIKNCLLYGRPLAFAPQLTWAWITALVFLGIYALLALLAPDAVRRCVRTFDAHPGRSLLAAFIGILLIPVLFVLLAITVVGIPAIPFVGTGLLCTGLFGRAVMLAWIGSRLLSGRGQESAASVPLCVLLGGVVVLALYVVPVLGFLTFQLLGILGVGAVIDTVAHAWREHRSAFQAPATPASAAPATETPAAPVAAATLPDAGFWIRMAALFLDAVLIGFITGVLHHAFNLELMLLAIYGAVMWKLRGATLGGIIFDLQVVRLDGRPMDWETAIVRALGCFLSLVIAGLGFIWIAFDASKQAWHDKIAGTVVVRVRKAAATVAATGL